MQFHFISDITNFIPLNANPANSLGFERYQIDKNARQHNLKLSIENIDGAIVVIKCEEDNHHKSTIHIVGNHSSCSCKEYMDKQCGYCKHISILRSVLKTEVKEEFVKVILKRKQKFSGRYMVYDSLQNDYIFFGQGEIVDLTFGRKKQLANVNFGGDINLPEQYKLTEEVTLFDYQRDILGKMLRAKRGLCCMVMGAGKTILSIAGIKELNTNNLLIICPKSIMGQWRKEIKRLLGQESIILTGQNLDKINEQCIHITTYQTIVRNEEVFAQKEYKLLIADEIQYIRNSDSKTWDSIRKIKSEYMWGLSGTIIENELDDLYNIMQIINASVLGPKWKFNDNFKTIKSITKAKILFHKACKNRDQLKKLIQDYVFAYDKINLAPINEQDIMVDLLPEQRVAHDNYLEAANKLISQHLNSGKMTFALKAKIQAMLLKTRQSCNTVELIDKTPRLLPPPKVKDVIDKIKDICINQNKKLVIYSEWTEMLDILIREIHKLKLDYVKFHGQLSSNARIVLLEKFLSNDNCKLFISSDAGGLGIDGLQLVCHNMIHIELPWNPAKLDQRNGRLNRLGQKNQVSVYRYIARDSIESNNIYNALKDKKDLRMDVIYAD